MLVTLRQGWATFPFALGMGLGFIVAPAAIADGPEGFQPIGAGAFTYGSYRPQEELVLNANPNYWDGEPYLDQLRFVWLGSDETKFESLQGGTVQGAVVRDSRVVKSARDAETSGWVSVESFGRIIMINRAEGRPTAEYPQVPEAIAHAIDGEELTDRVFQGVGMPSRHVFGPASNWHNEDAEVRELDRERAAELVEEAKAAGFDGVVELTAMGDPETRELTLGVQAQLEAVGFTVENDYARTVADGINKTFIERNFDFAQQGLALGDDDPYWRLFASFHSTSAANASSFNDPEYDALVDELRETEGEDRAEVLNRIENKILQALPTIVYGGNANMVMWADNVHGIVPANDAQSGFEKAWISD